VSLVTTDVSEELITLNIRLIRIGELRNAAVTSSRSVTLMMEEMSFSETSVLTRATQRNIPEDGILHSHRREILISYTALTGWTL
jgi:hypothetical protein